MAQELQKQIDDLSSEVKVLRDNNSRLNEQIDKLRLDHRELLSDYAGNLLVHTYKREDVSDILTLLENAVVSISHRNH